MRTVPKVKYDEFVADDFEASAPKAPSRPSRVCRTCDLFVKRICRADPGVRVEPRGDCPAWVVKEAAEPIADSEERRALLDAVWLLLRGYPKLWYQQADEIARVLSDLKRPGHDIGNLADRIEGLAMWVPKGHKRQFRKFCTMAGASRLRRAK